MIRLNNYPHKKFITGLNFKTGLKKPQIMD